MSRQTHEEYFLDMLLKVESRATCPRRSVGAIITDQHHHILATGYNGPPKGFPHCEHTYALMAVQVGPGVHDKHCRAAFDPPGDTTRCMAVHAEQNALLQCHRLDLAHTLYVSAVPCFVCARMICNTDIKVIVALEPYHGQGEELLLAAGIKILVAKP